MSEQEQEGTETEVTTPGGTEVTESTPAEGGDADGGDGGSSDDDGA